MDRLAIATGTVIAVIVASLVPFWANPAAGVEPVDREGIEYFEKFVRPVLAEHCYACHSGTAKTLQASLRVDHLSTLLSGGDSGPAIVPGDPAGSLLLQAVRYETHEMPPQGKLPAEAIEHLAVWIDRGAALAGRASDRTHGRQPAAL